MPQPVGAHAVGAAPGGSHDPYGPHGEQDGPGMLTEVRQAAVTAVAGQYPSAPHGDKSA
ncbi:hypothetical protein STENM36S_06606 [Streptomyces tendae]